MLIDIAFITAQNTIKNMLRALFCVRSHIISQKDLFQTLDWRYEASLE